MNVSLCPVLIPYIVSQHNEAYPLWGVPPPEYAFFAPNPYI